MKDRVMDVIEKFFRPEFLNRVDDVIVFRHLERRRPEGSRRLWNSPRSANASKNAA